MLIHNLQKKVALDRPHFEEFADRIKQHVLGDKAVDFAIAFISDDRMRQLNEMFRNKDTSTDVLSFPHEPDEFELPTADCQLPTVFLGDIVISAEQAQKQAAENGLSLDGEIKQLILHGLLHLCGYDHETDNGEMNARELELRDELGI
jgi:probable rRNA maturation factor